MLKLNNIPNNIPIKQIEQNYLKEKLSHGKISKFVYNNLAVIIKEVKKDLSNSKLNAFIDSAEKIFSIIKNECLFNLLDHQSDVLSNFTNLQTIFNLIEYLQEKNIDFSLQADNYAILISNLEALKNSSVEPRQDNNLSLSNILQALKAQDKLFTQEDINNIEKQYKKIINFSQLYKNSNKLEVLQLLQEIKAQLNYINLFFDLKEENVCKLIALAKFKFQQDFGISLYPVQIITVLALLSDTVYRGRIAQVKTGEGKSSIVTLLALVCAYFNQPVDIITSNNYLAMRDQKKYKDFFNFFSISSSFITIENFDFSGQIVYGTNENFEFAQLYTDFDLKKTRIKRDFAISIVDEIDNMFIDSALHSARIAESTKQNTISLIKDIYTYIAQEKNREKKLEQLTAECAFLQEKYFDIKQVQFKKLIENAYNACYKFKLNHHYCLQFIENKLKVVIIDLNTGSLHINSQWSHGLHQFLELKHKLELTENNNTIGSMSHPSYFTQYKKIFGLTGTIGNNCDRDEILEVYKLDSFIMPVNKTSLQTRYPTIICNNINDFNEALITEVKTILNNKRSILILCNSIADSIDTKDFFAPHFDGEINLLNELQTNNNECIIRQIGRASCLTIATNIAGRGTDIHISPEALKNGALHVIFKGYPSNQRIEEQGAGRSARNGMPGSYRIITGPGDQLYDQTKEMFKLNSDITEENILQTRDILIYKQFQQRNLCLQIDSIQNAIQKKFLDLYQTYIDNKGNKQAEILAQWAKFYTLHTELEIDIDNIDINEVNSYRLKLNEEFDVFCNMYF